MIPLASIHGDQHGQILMGIIGFEQ